MNTFRTTQGPDTQTRARMPALVLAIAATLPAAAAAQGHDCLVEPSQVVEVRSPVDGMIASVAVQRGDTVRRGQALVQLQSEAERMAVELARQRVRMEGQIASARKRAAHDLRIADNTYETVEASFQLRNLMRDSTSSFEAIQKLEAPTFEQIFRNEELRKEFENLTRKLDAPSS